jgi:hypothetical protein
MSNDNPSPSALASKAEARRRANDKHSAEMARVREEGVREGIRLGHNDLVDWLQERYVDVRGPARGSAEANALLKLAREASLHFKELDARAANKRRRS